MASARWGLSVLGGLGLGAVWGHLVGLRGGGGGLRAALALAAATGLVAAEVGLLAGERGAAAFALAGAVAWTAGARWRGRLFRSAGTALWRTR